MNIEGIKSVFLVFLVSLSLLLTWGLWTYYPSNDFVPNNKVVQDEMIGVKKDTQSLILPEQVIFHKDNKHYLSNDLAKISVAYKEIQKGTIEDVEDITDKIDKELFTSFIHGNNKLEIIFSTKIPKLQLDLLLQINDRSVNDNLEIDRIVIDFEQSSNSNIKVYLVNYFDRKVYEGYIENLSKQSFYEQCNAAYGNLTESIAYSVTKTSTLFLPKESMTLNDETYLISQLNPNAFKNALFTDPAYVKKEDTGNSESYIDGTRLLKVFYDTQFLQYVNPAIVSNQHSTSGPLVQKSIDFINDHQGWTDSYRFYNWNGFKGETVFRMYKNNTPIFSQNGMSTIQQKWGEEDIISYTRSLFRVSSAIQTKTKEVQLPSGKEIIQFIKESKGINSESIKGIFIGYEMNLSSPANKYINLTPTWIMNYENSYMKINLSEEEGGGIIGLESN